MQSPGTRLPQAQWPHPQEEEEEEQDQESSAGTVFGVADRATEVQTASLGPRWRAGKKRNLRVKEGIERGLRPPHLLLLPPHRLLSLLLRRSPRREEWPKEEAKQKEAT